MITTKQRGKLRAMSNELSPIFQLGKEGMSDNFEKQVDQALEARELVKVHVLRNCDLSAYDACDLICQRLGADPVQTIGNHFVIYRRSAEKPVIEI